MQALRREGSFTPFPHAIPPFGPVRVLGIWGFESVGCSVALFATVAVLLDCVALVDLKLRAAEQGIYLVSC